MQHIGLKSVDRRRLRRNLDPGTMSAPPDVDYTHARRRIEPLDLLMLVMTFAAGLWVIDPIYDINDVFWHILLGDQIRAGTPFAELGSTFSFSVENPDWRTGAWGSEFLMSWLYDLGGWTLLVNALRLGSIVGVSFVFWRNVVRRLAFTGGLAALRSRDDRTCTHRAGATAVGLLCVHRAHRVWWYRRSSTIGHPIGSWSASPRRSGPTSTVSG